MILSNRKVTAVALVAIAGFTVGGCGKKEKTEEAAKEKKHEENIVTLKKENLEHVYLQTVPAEIGNLDMTLRAPGRVSVNANKTAKVASTLEGRIIKLNFDLNDRVKGGDVVGLVQTPELLGKPLELKAPIDGVVTERKSTVGELVNKETAIYTISDPIDLWVIAEIKERDIGAVKVGQDARFSVLAYPNETFKAKLFASEIRSRKNHARSKCASKSTIPTAALSPACSPT